MKPAIKTRIIVLAWLLFSVISVHGISGQTPGIKIAAAEIWAPGLWSEVKVEISGGSGLGPCRFVQSFPEGFYVQPLNSEGCDMFFIDNTLNIVWTGLPAVKSFTVSYDVMPEKSISGPISLEGTFYYVRGSGNRSSIQLPVISVLVNASGTGKSAPTSDAVPQKSDQINRPPVQTSPKSQESGFVFRVQVLTSSSKFTEHELKNRLGVSFRESVTIVQQGAIYKYQVGSYASTESAGVLLKKLKEEGITEAFIVAYLNGEQITLERARSGGR